MAKGTDSDSGSFLGGGPRFNQAGENAPLPGEKVSDAVVTPLPFGGPRVWIGALVIIVLIAVLWMIYGGDLPGTQQRGGRNGVSGSNYQPNLNPDARQ